jgi:hypothetical protein
MRKKLKIDFLYKGQENENLATIVAQHNAGKNPVSLEDIASYLWVRRSVHDLYLNDEGGKDVYGQFTDDDKTKLHIMEKGKCVAILEEIELHELEPEINPEFVNQ